MPATRVPRSRCGCRTTSRRHTRRTSACGRRPHASRGAGASGRSFVVGQRGVCWAFGAASSRRSGSRHMVPPDLHTMRQAAGCGGWRVGRARISAARDGRAGGGPRCRGHRESTDRAVWSLCLSRRISEFVGLDGASGSAVVTGSAELRGGGMHVEAGQAAGERGAKTKNKLRDKHASAPCHGARPGRRLAQPMGGGARGQSRHEAGHRLGSR